MATAKVKQVAGADNRALDERCPVCGKNLLSTKFYYQCPDRNCGFKVSKNIAGKDITEPILKTILAGKATAMYSFRRKDGKPFKARLILADNDVKFDFSSGILCPSCRDKDVTVNAGGAFCKCGFKLWRKQFGKELTDTQLKQLLTKGETDAIDGFVKRSGENYSAALALRDDGSVGFKPRNG